MHLHDARWPKRVLLLGAETWISPADGLSILFSFTYSIVFRSAEADLKRKLETINNISQHRPDQKISFIVPPFGNKNLNFKATKKCQFTYQNRAND